MNTFSSVYKTINNDLYLHGGRSFSNSFLTYLFSASFRLLLNLRIGSYVKHYLFNLCRLFGKCYKCRQVTKRNGDISYNASTGNKVRFSYPIGTVISDNAIISDNARIWQQNTLGSDGGLKQYLIYPPVENGVKIFSGAIIIGGICLGENSIIGTNAVVNQDIPKNSTAVGIPAKIKRNEI